MQTKLDLESRFTVPPQVMSRLVEDETVILDIASGMYFGLDGVGKRIWESIADGLSLGDTASLITTEFEVDDAQAQADVIEFTTELVDRGLLYTA